jgi:polysaccharide export outer membrane protein
MAWDNTTWRQWSLPLPLAILLALGACARGRPSASPPATPTREVRLKPGDVIRIAVWRNEELSGEFTIAADSTIRHPLYKDVKVAGVLLSVVRTRLHEYLSRLETNPQFVVEPLIKVAVGGEVREPNLYPLPPETTIAQAIALAGGITERGRLDRVRLLRDSVELELDLRNAESPDLVATIRSGDRIFVRSRRNIFSAYVFPAIGLAGSIAAIYNVLR